MKSIQTVDIPTDGIESLKRNWKEDLFSGFMVFLISLPLCLGIAKASGFPGISGIVTAIVGGILVTLIHGSYVTIKGPAAGMIVIAGGSIQALGYEKTLAVIVVSGIVQILLGIFRAGKLGDFFPSSAIHGMFAAIGIIIAAKQLPHTLGVKPEAKSVIGVILEIPHMMFHIDPIIGVIGLISLILLLGFPLIKNKWVKKIPAPVLVLLITIPLGQYYRLDKNHLVNIPTNLSTTIALPDFSELFTVTSLYWIIVFALIGSLESLFSTKAVDILDRYKRKSDPDKDLLAVGIGNTICGFIGALPMISEFARSSANINNGAKSKWSNLYHGIFLLLSLLFLTNYINMIPLAALGAMLVFTGYRLASPKVFIETYKAGKEQLLIFAVTLVVTLATNLITGIFSGILAKFILHLFAGAPLHSLFVSKVKVDKNGDDTYRLQIADAAIFSNYLGLKKHLDQIPSGNKIILDFSKAKIIDHTVMEHLHHYGEDYSRAGGSLQIMGMEHFSAWSSHPLSYKVASSKNGDKKSSRREQMKGVAKSLHFSYKEFYPVAHSNYGKFSSDTIRIKYEENILTGNSNKHIYTISDLSLVVGGNMKAAVSQITTLAISNLHLDIPIFSIEKEIMIDKIMEKAFIDDIDFDEYPEFSKKYKLQGINESSIRRFFSKEIIEYLERNQGYNIDSLGTELIIYKPTKMLNSEEIKDALEFGKNLISVIEHSVQAEAAK